MNIYFHMENHHASLLGHPVILSLFHYMRTSHFVLTEDTIPFSLITRGRYVSISRSFSLKHLDMVGQLEVVLNAGGVIIKAYGLHRWDSH